MVNLPELETFQYNLSRSPLLSAKLIVDRCNSNTARRNCSIWLHRHPVSTLQYWASESDSKHGWTWTLVQSMSLLPFSNQLSFQKLMDSPFPTDQPKQSLRSAKLHLPRPHVRAPHFPCLCRNEISHNVIFGSQNLCPKVLIIINNSQATFNIKDLFTRYAPWNPRPPISLGWVILSLFQKTRATFLLRFSR